MSIAPPPPRDEFTSEDFAETLVAVLTSIANHDEPKLRATLSNSLNILIAALRIAEKHSVTGGESP